MANMNSVRDLADIEKDIDKTIESYNTAFKASKLSEMAAAEEKLKKFESEFALTKQNREFAILKTKDEPVVEGIKLFEFDVLAHSPIREDGVLLGIKKAVRQRKVNLVALCEFCGLSTVWQYKVEKMNLLFAYRTAKELGYNPKQLRELVDSWYLSELASREDMGVNPISNTQCCKILQQVVDSLLPEKGYKANNYDVSFLLTACVEYDRADRHTLKAKKMRNVHVVLLDVLNRIVTNGMYKVKPPKLNKGTVVTSEGSGETAPDQKVSDKDEKHEVAESAAKPARASRKVKKSASEKAPTVEPASDEENKQIAD